ncbi:MAG: siderophore-interacting protein [Pseudomonadota bacterium]
MEHRAHLAAPPDRVFAMIEDLASANGFDLVRSEAGLTIDAPLGRVQMLRAGTGADIVFGAESPAQLQLLKDLYAGRFAKLGLEAALSWDAGVARAPLNQTLAQVVGTQQISPNFMRLRLEGDFSAFARSGAGLHFRLLFSSTGAGWPMLDERGITRWPDGVETWHRPPYTVRALAPGADWMDIDIVLHAGGRVTDWCQTVAPGTEIALHGPSGTTQPTASWLGLVGDETALPVILRMVEDARPGTRGQAIILIRDPADAQPVETAADIAVQWGEMGAGDPTELLRELSPPDADCHIFFAAERAQATQARAVFKELGFPAGTAKAASYWTRST